MTPSEAIALEDRDSPEEDSPAAVAPEAPNSTAEDERIVRLVRQAAAGRTRERGETPASRRDEEDDIFRDMLAGVFAMNRRIASRRAEPDRGGLQQLYTADSFSSPEKMGRATRAVRQLLEDNRSIAREMQAIVTQVKARVEAARWPEPDKGKFLAEVDEGFAAKYRIRARILDALRRWSEATADLYELVLAHNDTLQFDGKTVRARGRETGSEFMQKLETAKRCRDEFQQAAAQLHSAQADLFKQWGASGIPQA
ncbi:MAG TPA: hypothetical protein VGS20_05870 [Candidatus Acidoferrales bacterium]|nr:hypothetical protein [Candidatus Acidoferrales bacterium]